MCVRISELVRLLSQMNELILICCCVSFALADYPAIDLTYKPYPPTFPLDGPISSETTSEIKEDLKSYHPAVPLKEFIRPITISEKVEEFKPYPPSIPDQEYGASQEKTPEREYGPRKVDIPAVVKIPAHNLLKIKFPTVHSIEQIKFEYPGHYHEQAHLSDTTTQNNEELKPYPLAIPFQQYGPPQKGEEFKPHPSNIPAQEYDTPKVTAQGMEYGPPKVNVPAVVKLPAHNLPKIQLPIVPSVEQIKLENPVHYHSYDLSQQDEELKPYSPAIPFQQYGPPQKGEESKPYPPAISSIEYDPSKDPRQEVEHESPAVVKLPAHNLPKIHLPVVPIEQVKFEQGEPQKDEELKPYPAAVPAQEYGPPQKNTELKPNSLIISAQEHHASSNEKLKIAFEQPKINLPAVTKLSAHRLPKIKLPLTSTINIKEYKFLQNGYSSPLKVPYPIIHTPSFSNIFSYAPSNVYAPPTEIYGLPAVTYEAEAYGIPVVMMYDAPIELGPTSAIKYQAKEYGTPAFAYGPPLDDVKVAAKQYDAPEIKLSAVTKLPAHDLSIIKLPSIELLSNTYFTEQISEKPLMEIQNIFEEQNTSAKEYGPSKSDLTNFNTISDQTPFAEYGPPK